MHNKSILLVAVVASSFISFSASAAVIAGWSMATAVPSGTVGSSYNYGAADSGDQTAGSMLSGFHTLATTVWSTPAGNGSQYSFSSNGWTAGSYYQVALSTTSYNDISISWDQTRSGTGPSSFELFASNDGGSVWTSITAYTVIQAGGSGTNTTSWNSTTGQSVFTNTASVGGASDTSTVLFQFRSLLTGASTGTNRIDNIVISGNLIPAPGAIALLGLAGLIGRRRR